MLVDKIIIERHPSKIDKAGKRHDLIRAIPYQDPQQEERLKAVHEARVKIVPRVQAAGRSQRPNASSMMHTVPRAPDPHPKYARETRNDDHGAAALWGSRTA
jgi:hypothetical protein